MACHDCDALYSAPIVLEGHRVFCERCGATLYSRRRNSIARATAFALAAAVFFVVANLFPFMTLKADYRESFMVLAQSVSGLELEGYAYSVLAAAVGVFTLGAPTLIIGGLLYLLIPLRAGYRLPWAAPLCRSVMEARRWNMVEVYLLGVLVSLLKLGKLATLTLGTSFWAYLGLIVSLAMAVNSIDFRELWARLETTKRL